MMNRFDPKGEFCFSSSIGLILLYLCDSSKPVRLHFSYVNSNVAFVVILYIRFCGYNIAQFVVSYVYTYSAKIFNRFNM